MLACTVNFPAYKRNAQQSCTCHASLVRCFVCAFGGLLLLTGLGMLCWIDQDDGRHSFGHSGGTCIAAHLATLLDHIYKFTWVTHLAAASAAGFICPFVPLLPVMCILINTYLLINLRWVSGPYQFFNHMFRTDIHFNMSEFVALPLCSSVVAHGCEWGCGWWWGCLCTFSMGAPTAHWRMSCTSLLLRRMRYMGHHLHQGLWPKGRWKETLLKPIFSYYMLQGTFFQNLEESDWSRSQLEHYALQAGLKNSICMSIL